MRAGIVDAGIGVCVAASRQSLASLLIWARRLLTRHFIVVGTALDIFPIFLVDLTGWGRWVGWWVTSISLNIIYDGVCCCSRLSRGVREG